MVLDAVARVEENLAAQRQATPDNGLAEALVAISRAVDEARAAAAGAIDSLALEETLVPVRKGARVIREIAWRWREIGTDGRICDLIDSQANAIEAGCGQIASINPLGALSAAFDLIEKQIAEFGDSAAVFPQAAEEAGPSPSSSAPPSPSDEMPASELETAPAAATDTAISTQAMPDETVVATHETAEATGEDDAHAADAQAADAHDEAVLDMIALEMSAPDPFYIDDPSDTDQIEVAELPPEDPVIVARQPEPPAAPAIAPSLQPSPQPSLQLSHQASREAAREPSSEPSSEPSLGSTLIANGILRKRDASEPDPLAPIRRMSQTEKIAFFS
jgi:hypothetical protein